MLLIPISDKAKELYYRNSDFAQDLMYLIVKETIRIFQLPYGHAKAFIENHYTDFDLVFVRHDSKVGFGIPLVSEYPKDFLTELRKKQVTMKEQYDLHYFELFDTEIVGCKTLYDVAAIIRYKEHERK